jgi:hypothetical protein
MNRGNLFQRFHIFIYVCRRPDKDIQKVWPMLKLYR